MSAALSVLFCFSMFLLFPHSAQSTVYVDPSYCLECHEHSADGIHSDHSEEDCNRCHGGTPEEGNVESQNCVDCHIDQGNGKCLLVGDHGSGADCTSCHFECTSPPARHIYFCLTCHVSDDLHDYPGHADCIKCHGHGGTVGPDDCMACHPLGDPGTCNLSNYHDPRMGTECFTCHTECTGVVTTTTTTIQTFPHYTNTCEQCHLPADLHAGSRAHQLC